MPTALESRAALTVVTGAAVGAVQRLLGSLDGKPEAVRADLLGAVPEVISFYADGSSALAADFYDDERERASARGRFLAEPVVFDRAEKIGRAIAWATQPLIDGEGDAQHRLAEVVRLETTRPYRDTITTNRQRDPEAVGWRRITRSSACRFCRMLADRGAVYKAATARFAAHGTNKNGSGGVCQCTAAPEFKGGDIGPEASVMQYVASKRRPTAKDRARVRAYLDEHYGANNSPKPATGGGLSDVSREWVEHQIRTTEALKASEWRTAQLSRLRSRLREF
jgi:hypothetical protein